MLYTLSGLPADIPESFITFTVTCDSSKLRLTVYDPETLSPYLGQKYPKDKAPFSISASSRMGRRRAARWFSILQKGDDGGGRRGDSIPRENRAAICRLQRPRAINPIRSEWLVLLRCAGLSDVGMTGDRDAVSVLPVRWGERFF